MDGIVLRHHGATSCTLTDGHDRTPNNSCWPRAATPATAQQFDAGKGLFSSAMCAISCLRRHPRPGAESVFLKTTFGVEAYGRSKGYSTFRTTNLRLNKNA